MLERPLSAIRKRLPLFGDARRARLWANRTFDDFVVADGARRDVLASIANHALRLTSMAREAGASSELVDALLMACTWIDSGQVRLAAAELRSYEDISVQVTALRRFIDYLCSEATLPEGSAGLGARLVEQRPDSRPALLVRAEIGRAHV